MKTDSEIYIKAAEYLFSGDGHYSCTAITAVQGKKPGTDRVFSHINDPARIRYSNLMLGGSEKLWRLGSHKGRELRVMLLLMMAAIAEDEDSNE